MILISFLDFLAIVSLLYAAHTLLNTSNHSHRFIHSGLLFLIVVFLFNSVPNFIEWMGYGDLMEPFEEYVQILLPAGFFLFLSFACYAEREFEVTSRSRVLMALHTITQNLRVAQDADELWKELLLRVINVMGFEGGFVDFPTEGQLINVRTDWPGSESFAQQVEFLDVEETILSEVIMELKPVVVEQAENMPDYFIQALHMSGVRSVALFPVFTEDRVLGVMGIVSRTPYVFSHEEVDLFSMLGHHLGEIILGHQLLKTARDQNLELQNALDARKHFLKIVTDDLREPLQRIKTVIQELGNCVREEDRREISHIIEQAREDSVKLDKLLLDVGEITLLDPGAVKLQVVPVDVRRELDAVSDRFRNSAQSRGVTLRLDLKSEYSPVEVDRNLIQSALSHLLSNAIRYTPRGGTVTLSAEEEADRILMRVADTGIGIRPEEGDKVFDMFYRTRRGRDVERTGTGLGLPIVRRIAHVHGGDLSYASTPGKGSVFTLALPRLQLG